MINLIKFRYIYGFLILIILVGGIYIAQITNIWDSENVTNNSDEEVATGLKTPTGKYTLGEIISPKLFLPLGSGNPTAFISGSLTSSTDSQAPTVFAIDIPPINIININKP